MSRNIIETVMGAVVLLVAAGFLFFVFTSTNLRSVSGYEIEASFSNASGVGPGTDVRMSGVKIGTVTTQTIDAQTFNAIVTMSIEQGLALPEDTSARIVPDGLLGGNFVELEPGGADANLEPGARIRFTQGAVNVVDLLGRFIFSAADAAGGEADLSTGSEATPGLQ
jgi:phospholipid/cholesterol/gamma-HCH transport system substrate-binding protein